MNIRLFCCVLAVATSSFLAAPFTGVLAFPNLIVPAAASPGAQRFVGTWIAVHDATPIIVLELHPEKEKLAGTMRVCSFRTATEGSGKVIEIADPTLTDRLPVHILDISGQSLSFDWKDPDGDENHWKLEVTGKGSGRLNWIGLPDGLKAEPIPVTRKRPS